MNSIEEFYTTLELLKMNSPELDKLQTRLQMLLEKLNRANLVEHTIEHADTIGK